MEFACGLSNITRQDPKVYDCDIKEDDGAVIQTFKFDATQSKPLTIEGQFLIHALHRVEPALPDIPNNPVILYRAYVELGNGGSSYVDLPSGIPAFALAGNDGHRLVCH
jgi:hypothetical protein